MLNDRGFTLPTVLILVTAFGILAAGLFTLATTDVRIARAAERSTMALNIAEAGIERAYALLRADPRRTLEDLQNVNFAGGSYSITAVNLGSNQIKLTSTGEFEGIKRVISAIFKMNYSRSLNYAIHVSSKTSPLRVSQNLEAEGDVYVNSGLVIDSGDAEVEGSVWVGQDLIIGRDANLTVSGDLFAGSITNLGKDGYKDPRVGGSIVVGNVPPLEFTMPPLSWYLGVADGVINSPNPIVYEDSGNRRAHEFIARDAGVADLWEKVIVIDAPVVSLSSKNFAGKAVIVVTGDLIITDDFKLDDETKYAILLLSYGQIQVSIKATTLQAFLYAAGKVDIQEKTPGAEAELKLFGGIASPQIVSGIGGLNRRLDVAYDSRFAQGSVPGVPTGPAELTDWKEEG